MSKKADRLNRIMQILKMRNGASIRELSSELEVSEMTVRRDLEVLSASRLAVSYTHLRAHETGRNLVCRLLLEKKKKNSQKNRMPSSDCTIRQQRRSRFRD